jgi:PAS domain S-box-containing protein
MMAIIGFDGRYRLVNPAFERTLGYTRDQIVARPFADLVHPDDLEAANEAFAVLLGGDEVNGFECRFLCADGSERWLQWSARVGPEQSLIYGTARDVTERRHIDAELREAQRTAEARGAELQVRAGEQAALRRVATLVAREAAQSELFSAIADEIGRLVGADEVRMLRYADDAGAIVVGTSGSEETFVLGARFEMEGDNVASRVLRTERTARLDDYERATGPTADTVRAAGIRSAVAAPIVVEGRLWGAIVAASTTEKLLPPNTESRLGEFTDLMATAIANTESRARADRLADDQAALRRVATLVAEAVPPADIFAAVSDEVGRLLGGHGGVVRYEADGKAVVLVGVAKSLETLPVGTRREFDDPMASTEVYRTGRSARVDAMDWSSASGQVAGAAARLGGVSTVASPIVVEGRCWGAVTVASMDKSPPIGSEARLEKFTELVATAIANAESREALRRLADEQAALRRVATLVAEGVQPAALFAAVTQEVARLFMDVEPSLVPSIIRFDPGPEFVLVGAAEPMLELPMGSRWGVRDLYVSTRVLRTGRSARVDATEVTSSDSADADLLRRQGFLYQVGSPIVVEGRLWGAMTMNSTNPLPPDSGERLESFTELVATAIANAESREGLRQLADEQSSLRRVATLVAEGASPAAVLDAVAAEMERVLRADAVTVGRYESGDEFTVVAHRGSDPRRVPAGTRVSHQGENVATMVRRTEHSARMEHREGPHGTIAELGRTAGVRASVGAPIVVDGRLWGVAVATWRGEQSPPPDTEERMAQFTQLLDTAIANADSRDQLNASRTRLVTEADEARRRVVRDLHDGAQQRLVHTVVTLRLAQQALGDEDRKAAALVGEALQHAQRGNVELRELAHGILPAALTHGGLRAGVDAVASRLDLPVQVDVPPRRFPPEIERSAYFIVAESLTNIVKHANARHAQVRAVADGTTLHVEVRDDGIGGADPHGHGLVGIDDRVTALGGQLDIESPPGGGTLVHATLPLSQ